MRSIDSKIISAVIQVISIQNHAILGTCIQIVVKFNVNKLILSKNQALQVLYHIRIQSGVLIFRFHQYLKVINTSRGSNLLQPIPSH